jgi:chromosome segregation ATPase
MIDRIDALEEKIAAFVDRFNEAKVHIGELQRQNRDLTLQVEEKKQIETENFRLQGRIQELESELNLRDDKESLVKDRLKMILNRIDTLEAEIMELDTTNAE